MSLFASAGLQMPKLQGGSFSVHPPGGGEGRSTSFNFQPIQFNFQPTISASAVPPQVSNFGQNQDGGSGEEGQDGPIVQQAQSTPFQSSRIGVSLPTIGGFGSGAGISGPFSFSAAPPAAATMDGTGSDVEPATGGPFHAFNFYPEPAPQFVNAGSASAAVPPYGAETNFSAPNSLTNYYTSGNGEESKSYSIDYPISGYTSSDPVTVSNLHSVYNPFEGSKIQDTYTSGYDFTAPKPDPSQGLWKKETLNRQLLLKYIQLMDRSIDDIWEKKADQPTSSVERMIAQVEPQRRPVQPPQKSPFPKSPQQSYDSMPHSHGVGNAHQQDVDIDEVIRRARLEHANDAKWQEEDNSAIMTLKDVGSATTTALSWFGKVVWDIARQKAPPANENEKPFSRSFSSSSSSGSVVAGFGSGGTAAFNGSTNTFNRTLPNAPMQHPNSFAAAGLSGPGMMNEDLDKTVVGPVVRTTFDPSQLALPEDHKPKEVFPSWWLRSNVDEERTYKATCGEKDFILISTETSKFLPSEFIISPETRKQYLPAHLHTIPGRNQFLAKYGVSVACKKGCKDNACNHDGYGIMCFDDTHKWGGMKLVAVLDGHGKFGEVCSQVAVNLITKLFLENLSKHAEGIIENGLEGQLTEAMLSVLRLSMEETFHTVHEILEMLTVREIEGNKQGGERFPEGVDARESGTTATLALSGGGNEPWILVGHIGDGKAVLYSPNHADEMLSRPLTRDHRPDGEVEKERIEATGIARVEAFYVGKGTVRPMDPRIVTQGQSWPALNMSRVLGDLHSHKQGVISTPEVRLLDARKGQKVVIATDGVWDVFTNLDDIHPFVFADEKDPEVAHKICSEAVTRWNQELSDGFHDDITCIVFTL